MLQRGVAQASEFGVGLGEGMVVQAHCLPESALVRGMRKNGRWPVMAWDSVIRSLQCGGD